VCSAVALKKEVTGEAQEVPVERNRGEEEVNYPQMQEVWQKTGIHVLLLSSHITGLPPL
jgi:hypothetical protein